MSVNDEIKQLGERVSSLETTVKYLDQNIHLLRSELQRNQKTPLWLKVMGVVNTGIFAWLSAITWKLAVG